MTTKLNSTRIGQALALLSTASFSQAAVTFNFQDGGPFDGAGVGQTATVADSDDAAVMLTLQTLEILGFTSTGTSLESVSGDGHITNVGGTNALGINSVNNGGFSGEGANFNPGEEWTFSFDSPVTLGSLDFSGWNDPGEVTFAIPSLTDVVIDFDDLTGTGGYTFLSPEVIPANTPITFGITSTSGEDGVRISFLTIDVVPIPEPSGALLGFVGLFLFCTQRRR